jgi:tRNA nucleotidyltransferase (CCA-adding enzyme)
MVKGLKASQPSRMFSFLLACGAQKIVMPELVLTESVQNNIDKLHQSNFACDIACQFALLTLDSPDRETLSKRLHVPRHVNDASRLLAHIVLTWQNYPEPEADVCLALIESSDALRRPDRFIRLCQLATWATGVSNQVWQVALFSAQTVDGGAIAYAIGKHPEKIREAVRAARLIAIQS